MKWRQQPRTNSSAILEVSLPPEVQWKPPLHKAASTLCASLGDSTAEKFCTKGTKYFEKKCNFAFSK